METIDKQKAVPMTPPFFVLFDSCCGLFSGFSSSGSLKIGAGFLINTLH
ncbi:MAG: hypothetical protein ACPG6Q_02980 [Candidatus Puniceispirillaceae bacterium]